MNMKPLRFWCQKVLPLVYDESLSYYEQLCKIHEYVNALNDNVNALKEYIDDYFNNLDIEETVKNIINEMLIKGKLLPFYTFNPIEKYYIEKPDDFSEIFSSIEDNVGLKSGIYPIKKDCTINCNILIPNGAIISVENGVSLKINGNISAGRYKIFMGDGFISQRNDYTFPEWFGAKQTNKNDFDSSTYINKAIKSMTKGVLSLSKNIGDYCYYINNPISFGKIRTIIEGENCVIFSDCDRVFNLDEDEYSESVIVKGIHIENIGSNENTCFYVNNTTRLYFERVFINNFKIGVYLNNNITPFFNMCNVISNNGIGIYVKGKNPSLKITNCYFINTNITESSNFTGVLLENGQITDVTIDSNEFIGCYNGVSVSATKEIDSRLVDFYIRNNIFDSGINNQIKIENRKLSNFHILNNFFNVSGDIPNKNIFAVVINSNNNFVVSGNQFISYSDNMNGINCNDIYNATFDKNTFSDIQHCIILMGGGNVNITYNSFTKKVFELSEGIVANNFNMVNIIANLFNSGVDGVKTFDVDLTCRNAKSGLIIGNNTVSTNVTENEKMNFIYKGLKILTESF